MLDGLVKLRFGQRHFQQFVYIVNSSGGFNGLNQSSFQVVEHQIFTNYNVSETSNRPFLMNLATPHAIPS